MEARQEQSTLFRKAINWAKVMESEALATGRMLTTLEAKMATEVGVTNPSLVRIAVCSQLPMPSDEGLREIASANGAPGPASIGLTLGYAIFVVAGNETPRVISHELRHVHQYEKYGGIKGFIPVYLEQIAKHGYSGAPLERDAREHELS